jgi:hypothetical protein
VSDGAFKYTPIGGTDLLYMSNTENDVFMDVGTQEYYILLSGRWFTSSSLKGQWAYVSADKLPEDFGKIPAESPKSHVRASVAGTEEAKEAVLDAQIPQTAAINRETATIQVEYDGEAEFKPIEGTDMRYAVNTPNSVVKVGDMYYCCHQGVWYESNSPTGPWAVCATVPDVIYTIPPSYPIYNVTYVRIYESTPTVVYVGYTPGYVGCYVYGGTVVYGTGYIYPAHHGTIYYARPVTWGVRVRYNPHTGNWAVGVGYRSPHGGGFALRVGDTHGGWWGARGYHRGGYVRGDVNINIDRSDNIYNRPENRERNIGDRDRLSDRNDRPGSGGRLERGPDSRRPTDRDNLTDRDVRRDNNVFADREGNVYRRTESGWQQRENSGWSDAESTRRSTTGQSSQDRSNFDRNRSNLERQNQARERGTQRTNNYQRSRNSGGSRQSGGSRGGGSRGGGRRR